MGYRVERVYGWANETITRGLAVDALAGSLDPHMILEVADGAGDLVGFAMSNAIEGEQIAVKTMFDGTIEAISGAVISRGDLLYVDANGKMTSVDTENEPVAYALSDAAAADMYIEILLLRHMQTAP